MTFNIKNVFFRVLFLRGSGHLKLISRTATILSFLPLPATAGAAEASRRSDRYFGLVARHAREEEPSCRRRKSRSGPQQDPGQGYPDCRVCQKPNLGEPRKANGDRPGLPNRPGCYSQGPVASL